MQDIGGFVWQEVGGFTAGTYTLSFYLGSRYELDGNQTVVALLDGTPIGTWALTTGTPFTLETVKFTVSTGGSHALEFMGTKPGDHTAFLSYVTIAPAGRARPQHEPFADRHRLPCRLIVTKVQLPNLYLRNLDKPLHCANLGARAASGDRRDACPHPPQGEVRRSLTIHAGSSSTEGALG